jgi:signal transduction histidine kinase
MTASFGAPQELRFGPALGFSDQELGGVRWRVLGLTCGAADRVLFVAQDEGLRTELLRYLTVHAMQPVLWSLPLAVVLIWLAVTGGLGALGRLAQDVAERSDGRLEPIGEAGVPTEVLPLIRALNRLMLQLRGTLALERRFAADASHELRTPLAIVRTHAQVARRAKDPGELQDALAAVDKGVERAARLVNQLLSLARLGSDSPPRDGEAASLAGAVGDAVADRQPAAVAKSIRLDCHLPERESAPVGVSGTALDLLVGNLVDNAIKYTPAGGWIAVTVQSEPQAAILRVEDSGPGIPAEDRELVVRRFYRGRDSDQPGAGLGLSIVKRICDLYGATLIFDDSGAQAGPAGGSAPGPGLRVEVRFPPLGLGMVGSRVGGEPPASS